MTSGTTLTSTTWITSFGELAERVLDRADAEGVDVWSLSESSVVEVLESSLRGFNGANGVPVALEECLFSAIGEYDAPSTGERKWGWRA
jgi:hypothetical protein